jgi:diguanylate cyclase (GGDEF)-like protein
MTDPLTGLPNRARFFDALARELSRANRSARPLAVAMADLDGFKAYNDAYGHLAGDALLKAVAALLPTGLRASELVARYGGDEFALLLPEMDAAGAVVVATRLCRVVSQFPFARAEALSGAPHTAPVTISVGVAVCPDDGDTTEALLGQADRRLYEAKRQGHNQVVGPSRPAERRRHPRTPLEGPLMIRSPAEDRAAAWWEGAMKDLSLAGVYCTIVPSKPPTIDEVLAFSITIPPDLQHAFPFSRLAGCGRVARADALSQPDEFGRTRWGVALEFGEDVMRFAAHSGNDHE